MTFFKVKNTNSHLEKITFYEIVHQVTGGRGLFGRHLPLRDVTGFNGEQTSEYFQPGYHLRNHKPLENHIFGWEREGRGRRTGCKGEA